MKKFLYLLFALSSLSLATNASAQEEPVQPFEFNGEINFGYDYNFGFSRLQDGKVLKLDTNYIDLDENFRNYIYINNANLQVTYNAFKIVNLNLSGSLVSRGLAEEPLYNLNSYMSFRDFLLERKNRLNNIWQRYGIIQDINFTVTDASVGGGLTIGQQLVPFGYLTSNFLEHPVPVSPLITPMTEYINFNLRADNETPYQNSTLTKFRDIGATLKGKYSNFTVFAGLYNGAGQNTFDNNNAKDIFGRVDVDWGDFSQFGVSHWRGRHLYFRNIYSENMFREEFEMNKTGIHGRLGTEEFYLLGEVIFSNDTFENDVTVAQLGWYLELMGKLGDILRLSLRYESFNDNNVLKTEKSLTNYNLRKASLNLRQAILPNLTITEEYSHIWEDLKEVNSSTISSFGVFSANAIFTF